MLFVNHFHNIIHSIYKSSDLFPDHPQFKMSTQKGKGKMVEENPMNFPVPNLDKTPLVDTQFKISRTDCEFDLYKFHNWAKKNYLNHNNDLSIWESFLPQFIFSQTHFFHELSTWCHLRYLPSKKAVIAQNNEIIFSISSESIFHGLQINLQASLHPFSSNSLMDLYKQLTFPQRAHIF